jgi:hypothetical protein
LCGGIPPRKFDALIVILWLEIPTLIGFTAGNLMSSVGSTAIRLFKAAYLVHHMIKLHLFMGWQLCKASTLYRYVYVALSGMVHYRESKALATEPVVWGCIPLSGWTIGSPLLPQFSEIISLL